MTRIILRRTGRSSRLSAARSNNGQIGKQKDVVTGKEVSFTYDSLNRMITAATADPNWDLSFGYDGFGNRLVTDQNQGHGATDQCDR